MAGLHVSFFENNKVDNNATQWQDYWGSLSINPWGLTVHGHF